jgi:hypothetical protein
MWRHERLARCSCVVTLAVRSALFLSRAHAQEPADPAQYQMLIDEGIREYELRNFLEARSLWARAQQHFPNARALRAIGMAEFELRHYRDSAAALAAALASEVRPLDAQQRAETEQLLARAENFLTHVRVFGHPWPSVVILDGAPISLTPGAELVLEVGDHTLEFALPGYFAERRQVRAVGGEALSIQLALSPIIVTPFARELTRDVRTIVALPMPSAPVQADRSKRQRWIWSGVMIASAALAAGLGFGFSGRATIEHGPVAAQPIAIRRGP